MSMLLTNPIKTGDLDKTAPDGEYREAKISKFFVDVLSYQMDVQVYFGNTIDHQWVQGVAPALSVSIRDEDFIAMVQTGSKGGMLLYDEVAAVLYTYMITKGLLDGTII